MTPHSFTVSTEKKDAISFSLPLRKREVFSIVLDWAGSHDLDLHALICRNTGSGSKIGSWDDIFSTYNVKRRLNGEEVGHLNPNADGTFSTYGGALVHSPDATDGQKTDEDESITITPDLLPLPQHGAIEIPLVATIHEGDKYGYTFKQVQNPKVIIRNSSGTILMEAMLDIQFGTFTGVQMGSLIIDSTGVQFHSLGVGFNGDFNQVIGHFAP